MLDVPFTIIDVYGKEYLMKYRVGLIGCDKNEKNEVFPVTGWIVSPSTEEDNKMLVDKGESKGYESYNEGDDSDDNEKDKTIK